MVFATPRAVRFTGATGPVSLDDAPSKYPNSILSDFFGDIFAALCLHGLIKVPPASQMDPAVVDAISATLTGAQRAAVDRLGEAGPGIFWLLKLAWTRLYGVLTMEAFGQIDRQITDSGLLFSELMRETFVSLGFDDDWDRLQHIAIEVAGRAEPRLAGP